MRLRPNGSRTLATLLLAILVWSWLSGRLRLKGLPAPFDVSRMDDTAQLAALALLCITLVAIVKLLARPG
jgi:hypothetical protein